MTLIETLQSRFDVALATCRPFECDRLNDAYHCAVDPAGVEVRIVPMPALLRRSAGGDALKGAFLTRFVRQIAPEFDVLISAYNFVDFGRPAIQFVADFSFDDDMRRALDPAAVGMRGLLRNSPLSRGAYLALCRRIAGGQVSVVRRDADVVIANSQWTARLLKARYAMDCDVIYPPVHAEPIKTLARSSDFVMLGRITPDKRVLEAIDILHRVRERGHRFAFHIVGKIGDDSYGRRVRRHAAHHATWVRLHGGLYGNAKYAFLSRHSFAIHAHRREAFGIAVAEMVKMGIVPIVPAASAPAEIVGDERLAFTNADHAVDVIDRLLRQPRTVGEIRRQLAARGALFSKSTLDTAALELVDRMLSPSAFAHSEVAA
ncbi:glycosyltransferase [Jiella sp. MQZ9-1]|nr:glycosyltransferase [Jiella flava]